MPRLRAGGSAAGGAMGDEDFNTGMGAGEEGGGMSEDMGDEEER
jgi:hypothetical protein